MIITGRPQSQIMEYKFLSSLVTRGRVRRLMEKKADAICRPAGLSELKPGLVTAKQLDE